MIGFDVFWGISDQYFVEKYKTNFFCKKKLSEIFVIGMEWNLELEWNLMLHQNQVHTSKCQCPTTAKGPLLWISKGSDEFFLQKKKLSEIFVRVPPLELAWNLMLPQNQVHTSKCQCPTTAKGPPFELPLFLKFQKLI